MTQLMSMSASFGPTSGPPLPPCGGDHSKVPGGKSFYCNQSVVLQAAARQAAREAAEAGEDPEEAAAAVALAPQQEAYGVPQLVVNEETGEVEERIIEAPQVCLQ